MKISINICVSEKDPHIKDKRKFDNIKQHLLNRKKLFDKVKLFDRKKPFEDILLLNNTNIHEDTSTEGEGLM